MTATSILAALAMAAQVNVVAGHDLARSKLSTSPWTAQDVTEADRLRSLYEARPVGLPWPEYRTKVFWRDSRHGSVLQVLLLKGYGFPPGDYLQPESHRLIVFDGGCSVVQTQVDSSSQVRFVCNGSA